LLREGLDIPEVSLVAILDADKEGFLRSETSLIQICGRAARNVEGRVIMYADRITKSIERTVEITQTRRLHQEAYNTERGIVPYTVKRDLSVLVEAEEDQIDYPKHAADLALQAAESSHHYLTLDEIRQKIKDSQQEMKKAAKELRFEDATYWRDQMKKYQELELL